MDKFWTVARHEFSVTVRRRGFIVSTAIFPVLMIIGLVVAQLIGTQGSPSETVVGYVDETGLFEGTWKQGPVVYKPIYDKDFAIRALLSHEINALIFIPSDYLKTSTVIRVEEGGFRFLQESSPPALEAFLRANLLRGRVSEDVLERVQNPARVTALQVDEEGRLSPPPALDFGRLLFFGVLMVLTMFSVITTASYFLEGLSEEKETRVMEILLSSLSPRELMLGKLVGLGAVGLLQLAIWVTFGTVLLSVAKATPLGLPSIFLGLRFPSVGTAVAGLFYFLFGYVFTSSLLGAVGAVTTSYKEAGQVIGLFIIPYMVPLWLLTPLIQNPGGVLAQVLSLLPFTAPTTGLLRLGFGAMETWELVLSLGVLGASACSAVIFTLRLFRAYLLSYGQRPGLFRIIRTIVWG